jgi:hypothetical protein
MPTAVTTTSKERNVLNTGMDTVYKSDFYFMQHCGVLFYVDALWWTDFLPAKSYLMSKTFIV